MAIFINVKLINHQFLLIQFLFQVLWKEIQALQVEQELDREFGNQGYQGGQHGAHQGGGHHGGGGYHGYPDRRAERERKRVTERKLGRLIAGAQTNMYDDSDSSRGEILRILLKWQFSYCVQCTNIRSTIALIRMTKIKFPRQYSDRGMQCISCSYK